MFKKGDRVRYKFPCYSGSDIAVTLAEKRTVGIVNEDSTTDSAFVNFGSDHRNRICSTEYLEKVNKRLIILVD